MTSLDNFSGLAGFYNTAFVSVTVYVRILYAFWVKTVVEREEKHEIGFFIAVVNYCVLSKFACFSFLCHRESCF